MSLLTAQDLEFLAAQGIDKDSANQQLVFLVDPPPPRQLHSACTVGTGILQLDTTQVHHALDFWQKHNGPARFEKWIPASGAASRMFHQMAVQDAEALQNLASNLDRFPFANELLDATNGSRSPELLAQALVGVPADTPAKGSALPQASGLNFGALPKALIPFHRYPEGSRTPLEEHIAEALHYGLGEPRLTLTVSPEHRALFESTLAEQSPGSCNVELTEQSAASRTLAYDPEAGTVVRNRDGLPVLRPGGHGSLLTNLAASRSDHLFVRNIDNIQPAAIHPQIAHWKKILGGLALDFSRRISNTLRELDAGSAGIDAQSIEQLLRHLGLAESPVDPAHWRALLDRPLRICGMVRNQREPGGGPFWVQLPNREVRPQIVESAEVDLDNPQQAAIWRSSSHFNPVDLACVIGRPDGTRYRLEDFRDPSAVFVTDRSVAGRKVRALERPGLWNGSMAYWHTVFVEVPASTFAPVKSIFDLLRPEHQPLEDETKSE